MITKPNISPGFTIEDIHKIREYHYELTKDMTTQEKINFYNEGGRVFWQRWKRESYREHKFRNNIKGNPIIHKVSFFTAEDGI